MAKAALDLGFTHRFERATKAGPPALLLLHGTGGDENDLLPVGEMIAPGSATLSVRGKVMEGGMPRFFRRIAEGVFDQEDLKFRTAELSAFIREAIATYALDGTRLVALGFSNGANIAASILMREPELLAGAVLMRAMVPFVPETPPQLARKPILILSGEQDPIVPVENARELAGILRSGWADVTLHWEDAGHALTPGDLTTARQWIENRF